MPFLTLADSQPWRRAALPPHAAQILHTATLALDQLQQAIGQTTSVEEALRLQHELSLLSIRINDLELRVLARADGL